jgi:hypothetical protein
MDNGSEAAAHVMPVCRKMALVMHKLGVVEKKKVDQQAGFAVGTYLALGVGTWCGLLLDYDTHVLLKSC